MKRFKMISLLMVMAIIASAQPPEAFKYQAVVRNVAGNLIVDQSVSFRTSIRDGTPTGTIIYRETHASVTNQFGLATLTIGEGAVVSGTFSNINWSASSKYLEVECDPLGGSSYVLMGTSKLNSVPYALFSNKSADAYWSKAGNNIYYNTGYVGIGNSSPVTNLSIKSSGYTHGIQLFSSDDDLLFRVRQNSDESGSVYLYDGTGTNTLALSGSGNSYFNAGLVGIGTSSPSAGLHVKGTGYPNSFLFIQSDEDEDAGIRFYEGSEVKWHMYHNALSDRLMIMNSDFSHPILVANQYNGKVGIGTSNITGRLTVEDETRALDATTTTGNNSVILGWEWAAVNAWSYNHKAILAMTNYGLAGDFQGNVLITGSLSKGSGSFLIDHPLDPENKLLRHNFIESPENLVVYRGKAKLNSNGETVVELPDYFEALTKENEATVTLTSIGKPFLTGYEWEHDYKCFKVYGDPDREISWVVFADRDDPVMHQLARPVEEEKGPDNIYCEKGKLLYPEAYGYPMSKLKNYEQWVYMNERMNKKSNDSD
ncbi:MAG: Ig-like domain-containing protein [Bacteroidales bacterium]|nr:Ig-like domain-containing protein [Bacteroidales bacterium]